LDILAEALNIDHKETSRMYKRYNQENVKFTLVSQNEYSYNSKNFDIPKDIENLSLSIKKMDSDETDRFTGKIISFDSNIGKVFFTTNFEVKTSLLYSIVFQVDRRTTDACLRAICRVKDYRMTNFFTKFDDESIDTKKKRNIKPPSKWFNKKIPEDAAQKRIVLNILSESAYPYPFIITGGPGTGKSSVIVETILQILDKKSFAHVLVTCQSNSACDEVAMRLRSFVSAVKVFRYWGYFTAQKKLKDKENRDSYYEKLIENSSILDRGFNEPLLEDFLKYKVVVATMTSADRLIKHNFRNQSLEDKVYKFQKSRHNIPKDHFDFIFVDECCAATEPESLIPITGLGMDHKKVNANIILVGDFQLLGPVLNSRLAAELGLQQSLLERMMRLELYNPETSTRVVKLTNNYRSHPEIFKYSNETFYNSSMEQMVSAEDHNFAMGWKQLTDTNIPIVFHSVEGEAVEILEYDGVSKFNIEEIEQIFDYLQNLMEFGLSTNKKVYQNQIGIASPYTAQVKKLRERLRDVYPFIDIGTTEFFQGREKPIMIISAVRTNNDGCMNNFMDDPRVQTKL
jgi:helicase MOV-10